MTKRPCRVAIACHPPGSRGGSSTLLETVVAVLESLCASHIEYLTFADSPGDPMCVEPWQWLAGQRPGREAREYKGRPVHVSGYVRRVEPLAAVSTAHNWREAFVGADILLAVSGTPLLAWPLSRLGRPYVVFAGTTLTDEKIGKRYGLARRAWLAANYPLLRAMECRVVKNAARTFVHIPSMAWEICRDNGVSPKSVGLFPVPVSEDLLRAEPAPVPGTVVWAARHDDKRKNTAMLLRAFARIAKKRPEARLVLLGNAESPALLSLPGALGISGRVEFRGWVSEEKKNEALRTADVFAIPSEQEGLCIAGLEAMACRVPVVSTRCRGPEAFVLEGENGLLVGRNDEAALASCLETLIVDRSLRNRMGEAARRAVARDYVFNKARSVMQACLREVWPEWF